MKPVNSTIQTFGGRSTFLTLYMRPLPNVFVCIRYLSFYRILRFLTSGSTCFAVYNFFFPLESSPNSNIHPIFRWPIVFRVAFLGRPYLNTILNNMDDTSLSLVTRAPCNVTLSMLISIFLLSLIILFFFFYRVSSIRSNNK